jgi:hypothetical protein
MIASVIIFVSGLVTGVTFLLAYQQAAEADRLEKLKGNPSKWGQR